MSQSHSVNTSIESCATHLLRQEESQSHSEKNALCERALIDQIVGWCSLRVDPCVKSWIPLCIMCMF